MSATKKLTAAQRHVLELLASDETARLYPITRLGGYDTGSYWLWMDMRPVRVIAPRTIQALWRHETIEVAPHTPAWSNGTLWITDAGRKALEEHVARQEELDRDRAEIVRRYTKGDEA